MVSIELEELITTSYLIKSSQTTRPVTVNIALNPANWLYQDEVLITENSGNDLTDFQVLLELTADNFDFTKAQDNGEDIRFTNTDLKVLPYWIESWDKVNKKARIWIRIPSIPANGAVIIWFFYGNPSAKSGSNGNAVFEFFDDFSDGSFKRNPQWITSQAWTASDYYLKFLERFIGQNIYSHEINIPSSPGIAIELDIYIGCTWSCYNLIRLYDSAGNVLFGGGAFYDEYSGKNGGLKLEYSSNSQEWTKLNVGTGVWKKIKLYTYSGISVIDYDNGYIVKSMSYGGNLNDVQKIQICGWYDGTGARYDNIRVRKYTDPEPDVEITHYGETTKPVGLNVHVKPAECKTVKTVIEQQGTVTKDITAFIQQHGVATKSIIADIVYYSWRTKPVQTKIWWDSGKTIRKVGAWIGEPATTRHITTKVGFPATTKPVGLKTPLGYSETWKSIRLKAEKYSEIVTRIVVADTRRTTYGFVTKPVGLNIGKYPYNAKTITTKVEQYGESVKPVSCDIWLAKGQSVKPVSCKVNKSRQIINVGLSIHEYTGESTRPVGLSVQPYGETVKPVGLSVWSDLSETVKPVGLSAVIPGEAHKPVKLSVWSDLSETVKPVGLFVVSYPETYKAVRANVSPTHRWIPVSANVVRSGMNYRAVKANIINEVWAFDWQSINARIEKYAAHTKNIRARRKVQVSIKYYEGYHIRPVSVNVNVPTANTRAVKLKIHMYKVYGTITDEEGKPVKDATVFLYKRGSGEFITAKTTKTNSAGYYEIPEVPYGNYHVIVIKQARTLNFGPITINGAHVDVKKDLPLYKASKDTCLEEIMSPRGDLFRFQVLYDEVFPDKSRIIEILLIWGDLYNQLPTYYRETDGIFKVETPASAKLTVLHDFFETGGKRSEGKDDHFITPTKDVSEFMWRASLYHPNFIGFIVRCNTRGNVYTILSTNIGGYIDKVSASPEEPGVVTPRPYPVRAKTSRPVRCCLPLPGIVGCPNACTREVRCRLPLPGATIRKISCCVNCIKGESVRPIGCDVELPYGTTSRPVLCHLPYRGTNTKSVGCCLPLPGIVGCPNFCSRPVKLCTDYYIAANTKLVKSNVELPIGTNTKSVKCYVRYPVICDLVGRLPGLLYPGYVSYPTVSGFILDESRQPTSGTVDVIDKETGILLYHCDVGDDGWYTFAVPPNRCYILVMCKPGYQCRMLEICIGETPVVDRNVTEFGGPPFECEINCYYYNRAFEFPPLVPLEDYYVYGHVYNSKTLEPLEGVFIVAGDYEGTCVTGPDGFYKIHLPAGTHDLVATKRGFKRAKATVVISSGVEQDLYLDPIIPRRITFTGGLIHKPIYI